MDKKNLFSQEALDKLKTPEKLDTLLHVTDSLSWMAVISIMLLLTGVVIWSVMGSFTVKAEGMGMVMDSGGIVAVTHTGGGSISELKVSPGEKIKEGEIVAAIQGNTEGGVFSAYSGIVEEVPVRTGNVINAGISSPCSLYNQDLGSMDKAGGYHPVDCKGFINICAIRLMASSQRDNK